MTRRKSSDAAEGPNPTEGGAYVRAADGSLKRDRAEEQTVEPEPGSPAADSPADAAKEA